MLYSLEQLRKFFVYLAVSADNLRTLFAAIAQTGLDFFQNSLNLIQMMHILILCRTLYYKTLAIRNHRFLLCHQTLQMQALITGEFKNQVLIVLNLVGIAFILTRLDHLGNLINRTHISHVPFFGHELFDFFDKLSSILRIAEHRSLCCRSTFAC